MSIKSWMINDRLVNQVSIKNWKKVELNCYPSKNCLISKKRLQIGLILGFILFKVAVLYLKSYTAACTIGKNPSVFCTQMKKIRVFFNMKR